MTLALGSIVAGVVLAPGANAADPTLAVTLGGEKAVLAGETATFSLSAKNSFDDAYNLAFTALVPVGVDFDSATGGLGAPVVRTGAPYAPAGFLLWVWEDVADLPTGATFASTITVKPAQPAQGTGIDGNPAVFPVGSEFTVSATAYASEDARLLPYFPGSTGKSTSGDKTIGGNTPAAITSVEAIRVTKSEPSPEQELLRGAQDQHTTYSIVIKNTSEGETRDVVVVDYLPAGLEFIGDGSINPLSPAEEYPTSGPISNSSPAKYKAPQTVETITAGASDPGYLDAGKVYTKVTWVIPALAKDAEITIEYLAAVPLYENVMWPEGETPAIGGDQTAHLGNNTGRPTREGTTDASAPSDGQQLTNWASASGQYQGVVRSEQDRAASDSSSVTVTAEDLAIVKSSTVDIFDTGEVARFTLTLRTSEYVTAGDLVVTDTIDNGLRPVLPAGTPVASGSSAIPSGWFDDAAANVVGGTITSVSYDAATGITVLTFSSSVDPLPANTDGHDIVYSVVMRESYDDSNGGHGFTTSGDVFGNHVSVSGTTTSINPLNVEGWFPETNFVLDESAASISSDFTKISKSVLPRDLVLSTGTDPGATTGYVDGVSAIPGGFRQGDTVVYELKVTFPGGIDTRNAAIADFMPEGITPVGWKDASAAAFTDTVEQVVRKDGGLLLKLGTVREGGADADRYVKRGSVFTLHVWGTVDALSPNAANLDKPQNLMKYRQENVDGDVFFLRDAATIQVEAPVSLLKGVQSVNGEATRVAASQNDADGTVFNSNRDGIEVREDERVLYRIDLSAPPFAVTGLEVWDALPAGVKKKDVSGLPSGATAYNPGDTGYPADLVPAAAGRSVIVWTGLSLAANQKTTLNYTVTVPQGVGALTELGNTASIISYDVALNRGTTPTEYRPNGSLSSTPGTIHGGGARDDSLVTLPNVVLVKDHVGSEVAETTNTPGQIVQGETVTYTYTATVAKHTSVLGGVLSDDGAFVQGSTSKNFTVLSATHALDPTASATGFVFTAATGELAFPAIYINDTDADQIFSVTITVFSTDAWAHNANLVNTARFVSETTELEDTATVQFIVPEPSLEKEANKTTVAVGESVTYTLIAKNAANRPTAHEAVVTDIVPKGLTVVTASLPGTVTAVVQTDGTTLITWPVGDLGAAAEKRITYLVTVNSDAAGGAIYTNTAELTAYTLPTGTDSGERGTLTPPEATKDVRVPGATIDKVAAPTVAGATSIGDTVDYVVTVTLPKNTNFFDVRFSDVMPAGLGLVGTASIVSSDTAISFVPDHSGSTLSWTVPGGDLRSETVDRTVTISYRAVIEDEAANAAGFGLTNVAAVTWNIVNDDPLTEETQDTDATVTVREPVLAIAKKVNDVDAIFAGQQQVFTYGITVSNPVTTTSATAYDAVVTDVVPTGVIVDQLTITPAPTAVTVVDGIVTKITWALDELAPGETADFGYDASLAATSTLDASALVNTASIPEYYSTADPDDENRREYTGPADTASVTPAFPYVSVVKDVASGQVARVGTAFGWKLTATNSGKALAKTVTLVDTLPSGWGYDSDSSTVTVGAVTTPLDDPVIGSAAGRVTLTWTLSDLAASGVASVNFTTTPTTGAYRTPGAGIGSTSPHINTVSVSATDVTGATENKGSEPFSGGPDDARAFLNVTDLAVVKTLVTTGPVDVGANVTYLVTVTNNGPDAATAVTAVDALPTGLTFTGVTTRVSEAGLGWGFTFAGDTLTGSLASLASGQSTSFKVTAKVTAAGAPSVTNSVTVATEVPETDYTNNTSSVPVTVTPVADLVIDKQFAGGTVVAGESITWTLDVSNLGPSTAAGPIVVTDTLPAGVSNVAAVDLDESWSFDGITDGVATFTRAAGLALGDTAPTITLTMTVDSSVAAGTVIANTATVSGATKEINTGNNTDTAVTDPSGAVADLALAKSIAAGGTLTAGEGGRYRIDVENLGVSDAVEVTVTDTLPAELAYAGGITSDTGHTWAYRGTDADDNHVFALTSGSLAAGASTWFEFDVDVDASATGDLVNYAVVKTTTDETELDNNEGEVSSPVTVLTNLVIAKVATAPTGRIGDLVSFTVTVTNEGPATATNVVVTDALPAGLTFENVTTPATGAGWTFEEEDDTLTATLDDPLGVTVPTNVVTFTVTARVTAAAYPSVTNGASVVTDTPESNPDDNSDSADVTVPAQVDLAIVKTVGADGLSVGQTGEYILTVTNNGPTENPGVIRVADVLPETLRLVSVDTEDCEKVDPVSGTGGAIDCEIPGPLAVGGSFTIVLTVDVLPGAYPDVTNTATVGTDSEDTDPENDESTIVTPVTPDIRFALAKKLESVDGATLVWKITVESIGLNDAVDGVTVVDELPKELTFVSATSEDGFTCEHDAGAIECVYPDPLPTGERASFLVTTTTSQAAGAKVVNRAYIVDPDTDKPIPGSEVSADYTSPMPVTGGTLPFGLIGFGVLALLLGGGLVLLRGGRRNSHRA